MLIRKKNYLPTEHVHIGLERKSVWQSGTTFSPSHLEILHEKYI